MLHIALYTALSRAKSESVLFVVGNLNLTNKLSEKDSFHLELKRFREHCAIMWCIPLISTDIYVQCSFIKQTLGRLDRRSTHSTIPSVNLVGDDDFIN